MLYYLLLLCVVYHCSNLPWPNSFHVGFWFGISLIKAHGVLEAERIVKNLDQEKATTGMG